MTNTNHEKELLDVEKAAPEQKTEPALTKEEELTELLKRTQANFENYRKQVEKRIEDYQQFATKDLLLQLLPLLDNFELALKTSAQNVDDLKKGIEMIYAQLFQMLESQGLELIPCCGKFDPYLHEALMKEESDKPEGTILEELQKGFTLNGKVIRHAKVKISTHKK